MKKDAWNYVIYWDAQQSVIGKTDNLPDGENVFSTFGEAKKRLMRAVNENLSCWRDLKSSLSKLRAEDCPL